ncbi:hypothetical protein TREMEDRAFT_65195 [Tremella mesenterica DSM 1558]|uniref:uncharacterized protein n=1 Tax=Tremella mesenterica (strain ATCC 24925 / CBS 8224 / DSM 1558 / NBRC 9311 / NRRL Y-6157 / RJB 2259-6 / UBC 559-6) TaxID=578456 RepID=UPI00032C3C37|nr:uncharacterized protein TREMEDRAFT_65195 [Tremella mesenterica DSM 1558]EIW66793.1 hypothetical protein TREMEDRAFT_65195 [Tremella mesenterica DSM 1558]
MSVKGYERDIPDVPEALLQELENETANKRYRMLQYMAKTTLEHLEVVRPKVKDIAGFWLYTLSNHVALEPLFALKEDQEAMNYCTDVELVIDPKDPRAFKIILHFKENPFFTNDKLIKAYELPKNVEDSEEEAKIEGETSKVEGEITKEMRDFDQSDLNSTSMKIDWKSSEVDLCAKFPRQMSEGEIDYDGDKGSFFYYFTAENDPYAVGPILSQDVLTEPIEYFTGRADNCREAEYSEDEEDEEDDEDEDEIDLEEEEPRDLKRRKLNGA